MATNTKATKWLTPSSQTGLVALEKRIERTSTDFTDGLVCGYLAYFDHHSGRALSDRDIFNLFAECLPDVRYTQLFNAGWCMGLIEALIEDRSLFAR
jgi:hypothetical protein